MSLFKASKKDFNGLNHVNLQPSLLILSRTYLHPTVFVATTSVAHPVRHGCEHGKKTVVVGNLRGQHPPGQPTVDVSSKTHSGSMQGGRLVLRHSGNIVSVIVSQGAGALVVIVWTVV